MHDLSRIMMLLYKFVCYLRRNDLDNYFLTSAHCFTIAYRALPFLLVFPKVSASSYCDILICSLMNSACSPDRVKVIVSMFPLPPSGKENLSVQSSGLMPLLLSCHTSTPQSSRSWLSHSLARMSISHEPNGAFPYPTIHTRHYL